MEYRKLSELKKSLEKFSDSDLFCFRNNILILKCNDKESDAYGNELYMEDEID